MWKAAALLAIKPKQRCIVFTITDDAASASLLGGRGSNRCGGRWRCLQHAPACLDAKYRRVCFENSFSCVNAAAADVSGTHDSDPSVFTCTHAAEREGPLPWLTASF